ncbi:hypothetical protein CBS63078_10209 [Aspergillus niger]|nr:hypothetical protein CBS63078_10209 [Aspergillus niger]
MSTDTSVRQNWEPLPQAPILDAGSLQEKSLQDLSEEQAGDILNLVLVSSTEDPTEFTSELERKIIPVGFGLSLADLNEAFQSEYWTRFGVGENAMTASLKIRNMIQKLTDRGQSDPASRVYYRIDPDDTRNMCDPEPNQPANPPPYPFAQPANQPNNQQGGPNPQQESSPAHPVTQSQHSAQNGAHNQVNSSNTQLGSGPAHPVTQSQYSAQNGAHNQVNNSNTQQGSGPAHPVTQSQHSAQNGAHNQVNGSNTQQGSGPAHPVTQSQHSAQNGARNINAAETGTHHAAGSRRLFSVRPKKVQHQVTPGFTTFGEEIHYIQPLGNGRANFVVKTPDECYSLVDSSISGGSLAIEAAKNACKPFTTSDETKLKEYQELVTRGGQYGISFVAPAQDPNRTVEAAVSRSNLGKILKSPRQAEHMIVQGLGVNNQWQHLPTNQVLQISEISITV